MQARGQTRRRGSGGSGRRASRLAADNTVLERAVAAHRDGAPADRLLAVATERFYREGIRAVGVDRLVAEAGVAKATFYAHFPSKTNLVVAYLRAWDDAWRSWLTERVAAAEPPSADSLLAVFDALADLFEERGYRGCAFSRALDDMGDVPAVAAICREHKAAVHDYLADVATQAGHSDPEGVAAKLALLVDGAMAVAARDHSREPALRARGIAEPLVAVPRRRRR